MGEKQRYLISYNIFQVEEFEELSDAELNIIENFINSLDYQDIVPTDENEWLLSEYFTIDSNLVNLSIVKDSRKYKNKMNIDNDLWIYTYGY